MTGTTTTAVTLCSAMSSKTWSGLNLLCTTNVDPRNMPMVACRKPRAWNIGAGNAVTSFALNGTCDRMPPIGANVGGVLRFAPFGVPVVPLVRMMIDERLLALGAGDLLWAATRSARVSSSLPDSLPSGLVSRARSLPSGGSAWLTSSVYSSS